MKYFGIVLLLILFGSCDKTQTLKLTYPQTQEGAMNFIIASDLGRNGYYEQKPIAEIMGLFAENKSVEFVAAAGDVHHFNGVASTSDPLWTSNFENIYSHPDLMIDWFAICGNHEYRGNTQSVLDYSKVSRRWVAPDRYYTKVFEAGDNTQIRLIFIDTSPLIDKYRSDSEKYPDACKQDEQAQLKWIDSVLANATEKWKIVIGHHPVFCETNKTESERLDLQKKLAPILEQRGVDFYFCGHIHNFQHIKPAKAVVEYVVNSAGSLSRPVKGYSKETKFSSDKAGFTFCSVLDNDFTFSFIDGTGKEIYNFKKSKK